MVRMSKLFCQSEKFVFSHGKNNFLKYTSRITSHILLKLYYMLKEILATKNAELFPLYLLDKASLF
jgi:hypothetical protein